MKNEYYTVFVSKTGKHDHTAFLWYETKDKAMFEKSLIAAKLHGYKVSKIYKPSDLLAAPNFIDSINK